MLEVLGVIVVLGVPFAIAITVHEYAHGWAAWQLGDSTAKDKGRLSFNPLVHLDPVGSFLIPGLLIVLGAPFILGWAKPVPVDSRRLNDSLRDWLFVGGLAPATNFVMAFIAGLMLYPATLLGVGIVVDILLVTLLINMGLGIINMFPLPPLDGWKVLSSILPRRLGYKLMDAEANPFILFAPFVFLFTVHFTVGLSALMSGVFYPIIDTMLWATGWLEILGGMENFANWFEAI